MSQVGASSCILALVPSAATPLVSVLMPTFERAAYLPRAIGSLLSQSLTDWELVVVDDGSRDGTEAAVRDAAPPALTYLRQPENRGLGAALNLGTAHARGRYLAFLPDDDVYHPEHLARCVATLAARPEAGLAYGGVLWHRRTTLNVGAPVATPLLRDDLTTDDLAAGDRSRILDDDPDRMRGDWPLASGNPLALVQVMLDRRHADRVGWTERDEFVSDTLEYDFWRGLLRSGVRFAYTGGPTCEWSDHPDQRHKLISGRGRQTADWRDQSFGLSCYRQRYRVPANAPLRWRPAGGGLSVDEHLRYQRSAPVAAARPHALRILVVGALGFNPDRLLAFLDRGCELYGTWLPDPPFWDTSGPPPVEEIVEIPFDAQWSERVAKIRPDVVYALLGWNAVPFLHQVLIRNRATARVPFVLHFKESPFAALRAGYWPRLYDLVTGADGRLFASVELRDWFETATLRRYQEPDSLVFDGEYPRREWLTDDWTPKLSDVDGEAHTACVGRSVLESMPELAARRIHVHVYALPYMRAGARWAGGAEAGPYLHLHPPVGPPDWVRELSRYDAGWMHVFDSANHGDTRLLSWHDMNLPARIGTYAAAGLPWLYRGNRGHRVATGAVAGALGVGIGYHDLDDLAARLATERRDRQRGKAMRTHRDEFCFDHHVDRLVGFFSACKRRAYATSVRG
jgi:glycosyltransferase involved in cell wall biosynthesis